MKEQRQRYWSKAFEIGARLSKAVVAAGPSCANVFSMFVRAPENDLNYGADVTLAVQEMEDRFSEAYSRAFDVPLLDHSSYYRGALMKNFHPYSYRQLVSEYPCVVVRTPQAVEAKTSLGLLELNPGHCLVAGIYVYTVIAPLPISPDFPEKPPRQTQLTFQIVLG